MAFDSLNHLAPFLNLPTRIPSDFLSGYNDMAHFMTDAALPVNLYFAVSIGSLRILNDLLDTVKHVQKIIVNEESIENSERLGLQENWTEVSHAQVPPQDDVLHSETHLCCGFSRNSINVKGDNQS